MHFSSRRRVVARCRIDPTRRHVLAAAGALCLCCPPPPALAKVADHEWTYTCNAGPASWKGSCASGASQSPIDFPAHPTEPGSATPYGPLKFRYPRFTNATCTNNGHGSPQINLPEDVICEIGGVEYRLLSVHWHTPSEHSEQGVHAPLEVHLVHRSAAGDTALLAVMMHTGPPNSALQAALDSVPLQPLAEAPLSRAISLLKLLPPPRGVGGLRPYVTYEGSLTTPPCTERVRWFVLLDGATASAQQVLDFQKFVGGGSTLGFNARPQQPLNGRELGYLI